MRPAQRRPVRRSAERRNLLDSVLLVVGVDGGLELVINDNLAVDLVVGVAGLVIGDVHK